MENANLGDSYEKFVMAGAFACCVNKDVDSMHAAAGAVLAIVFFALLFAAAVLVL